MANGNDVPALVGRPAKLIAGGEWAVVRLAEISPKSARFVTDRALGVGDAVVACIAEIGAFAGVVEAVEAGVCSVAFREAGPERATALAVGYRRAH